MFRWIVFNFFHLKNVNKLTRATLWCHTYFGHIGHSATPGIIILIVFRFSKTMVSLNRKFAESVPYVLVITDWMLGNFINFPTHQLLFCQLPTRQLTNSSTVLFHQLYQLVSCANLSTCQRLMSNSIFCSLLNTRYEALKPTIYKGLIINSYSQLFLRFCPEWYFEMAQKFSSIKFFANKIDENSFWTFTR